MRRAEVDEYLRATADVEGWLFPIDACLLGFIDWIQKNVGVSGNLFEIGVHHGKSAVLLARATVNDEVLGVCDVFEDQASNVDQSGKGSRELFLKTISAFCSLPAERLRVFAKRSNVLTREETTSACRIFHIDGGHRPADVLGDLRVATAALLPAGVVVMDDVFHPSWPGVSEGFYEFMKRAPRALVPLIIGGNKVFLTRPDAVSIYREHLSSSERWTSAVGGTGFVRETKEWLGHTVYVAGRTEWVDLNPIAAARKHLGCITWRDRLRILRGN